MLTTFMTRYHRSVFAGGGHSAGPSDPQALQREDYSFQTISDLPIAVYQSRGENDKMSIASRRTLTRQDINMANLNYWLQINKSSGIPSVIKIDGRHDYFMFTDGAAPMIYRDVKFRYHGQTIDDADQMWRQLFSGCSRQADGTIRFEAPVETLKNDNALIFSSGIPVIFLNGIRMDVKDAPYTVVDAVVPGEAIPPTTTEPIAADPAWPTFPPVHYLPLSLVEKAYGVSVEYASDRLSADLTLPDGHNVTIANGNVACEYDGNIQNLDRQVERKGDELFLPASALVRWLNLYAIEHNGVIYLTDHFGYLTDDFAYMLKQLLKKESF